MQFAPSITFERTLIVKIVIMVFLSLPIKLLIQAELSLTMKMKQR
jgi:hypothetical protein